MRSRGRNNGNRPFGQQQRPPPRGQTFDSHGPDVRIRGTAHQIFERYIALAREAATVGDRVAAENLYQHAEHYFRVSNASRDENPSGASRPADAAIRGTPQESGDTDMERSRPGWGDDRPGFV
jgi:hypothetical protein